MISQMSRAQMLTGHFLLHSYPLKTKYNVDLLENRLLFVLIF